MGSLPPNTDFRENDTYKTIRKLFSRDAGPCTLLRSRTTGKLIVTKIVRSHGPKIYIPDQNGRNKLVPSEARMLLDKLAPHPNIIRLFACRRDGSGYRLHRLYFEYCAGGDLLDQMNKFVNAGRSTPESFTLHVLVGLVDALAYVHYGFFRLRGGEEGEGEYRAVTEHQPIIHGDLKPDNVFLRWLGRRCGMPDIVLGDFGGAQMESESQGISGTPKYDSPEVRAVTLLKNTDPKAFSRAQKQKIMSTKSDMYQVGLILHLMATQEYWKVGADPSTSLDVPAEYKSIKGFVTALVWFLQPDPEHRPECTLDVDEGFLLSVDVFRRQRDEMFARNGALSVDLWNISSVKEEGVERGRARR